MLAAGIGHPGPLLAQAPVAPAAVAASASRQGEVPAAPPPPQMAPGTPARVALPPPRRPQLTAEQAAAHARPRVLAAAGPIGAPVVDGWDPLAAGADLPPGGPPLWHYRVDPAAADGRRVFARVQAAVQQAHADALAGLHPGTGALIVAVAPGVYDELVVVPPGPRPLALWGEGDAPDAVRLQANVYSQMPGERYAERIAAAAVAAAAEAALHPDVQAPHLACGQRARIGTDCAVVLRIRNDGFVLRNLTVANRYAQDQPGNLHQAVAVMTDGADRVHLEQVQLFGHQDTLFLRNPAPDRLARVLVHRSLVAGDVDFIFGDAIGFFQRSEIRWVGGMRGARSGFVTAPSTAIDAPFGFVFDDCLFSSDGLGLAARRKVHLGRQWFYGARCSPYGAAGERCVPEPAAGAAALPPGHTRLAASALRAVGKVVVMHSRLGRHIHPEEPWAPWNRQPDSPAYRPPQHDSDDFFRLLAAAGHDATAWGWARPAPAQPWLAEHRNRTVAAEPQAGDNDR